jgi:hypothetical protein
MPRIAPALERPAPFHAYLGSRVALTSAEMALPQRATRSAPRRTRIRTSTVELSAALSTGLRQASEPPRKCGSGVPLSTWLRWSVQNAERATGLPSMHCELAICTLQPPLRVVDKLASSPNRRGKKSHNTSHARLILNEQTDTVHKPTGTHRLINSKSRRSSQPSRRVMPFHVSHRSVCSSIIRRSATGYMPTAFVNLITGHRSLSRRCDGCVVMPTCSRLCSVVTAKSSTSDNP